MKLYWTQFVFLVLVSVLNAQIHDKSLNVSFEDQTWYVNHTIEKGETVYGIATALGSEMIAVTLFNDEVKLSDVAIGDQIRIPLSNISIKSTSDFEGQDVILFYNVKPLETLYKISREMIDIDVVDLMKLNNKDNHNLTVGEKLLIGYLPVKSFGSIQLTEVGEDLIEAEEREFSENLSLVYGKGITESAELDDIDVNTLKQLNDFFLNDQVPMVKTKKGLATWSEYQYEGGEYLAMHKSARVNSQISLYNPMLKKVVNATVVGQIPVNHYANNISVVLSPSAANALGALDKQFLVEMTYIE